MVRWDLKRTACYNKRQHPDFPKPVFLLGRPRWRVADIEAFERLDNV